MPFKFQYIFKYFSDLHIFCSTTAIFHNNKTCSRFAMMRNNSLTVTARYSASYTCKLKLYYIEFTNRIGLIVHLLCLPCNTKWHVNRTSPEQAPTTVPSLQTRVISVARYVLQKRKIPSLFSYRETARVYSLLVTWFAIMFLKSFIFSLVVIILSSILWFKS